MRKAILLLANLLVLVVHAADVGSSLELNRNLYSNALSKIEAERTRGLASALQGYADGLVGVRRVFVAKPDLDGVKAVDMAKEEACRGNVVTNSPVKELVELSSKYQTHAEIADKSKDRAHLDLLALYLNTLEKTQRALLGTNDMARAELVDEEIKKVKDLMDALASGLKVVKLPEAAGPVKSTALAASPARSKSLTGTWFRKGNPRTGAPDKNFQFKSDGNFSVEGHPDAGTWEADGSTITLTWLKGKTDLNVRVYKLISDIEFSGQNGHENETYRMVNAKGTDVCKVETVNASQWKEITSDFKGGRRTAEGIVIRGEKTQSKLLYRPPLEIKYVCKTSSTNIRIAYACPQIIFNWEMNMDELRMAGSPIPGKGRVPTNQFVTIRQVILNDRMEIYVDDEKRGEVDGDFSKVRDPIAVFSPADVKPPPTLTVKSVSVRNPKGMFINN